MPDGKTNDKRTAQSGPRRMSDRELQELVDDVLSVTVRLPGALFDVGPDETQFVYYLATMLIDELRMLAEARCEPKTH